MEINASHLVEKIAELRDIMNVVRGSEAEPKVNVEKLIESFDPSQLKVYKAMMDHVTKLDRLFHANYDSTVAQAVNAEIKRIAADANERTRYVVDIDTRSRKLEYEGDVIALIEQAAKLRDSIVGLHMYLSSSGVDIPNEVYKKDDKGNFILNTAGEKQLKLPKVPKVAEDGKVKRAGRPSRSKTLILGTVNSENDEVTWFDNDHIGKTFVELFGTIRVEHNAIGLFKAVEKSNQSVTTGWENPVEYAGKLWVAKTRDSANVDDVDDDDNDDDDNDDE